MHNSLIGLSPTAHVAVPVRSRSERVVREKALISVVVAPGSLPSLRPRQGGSDQSPCLTYSCDPAGNGAGPLRLPLG